MIRRWLTNVALAAILGVAWMLGVVVLSVVGSAGPVSGPSMLGGILYGLFEWAIFGSVPVMAYLVIGEVVWERVPRQRLASVILGAVVVVAYVLALRAGHVALSPEAVEWLVAVAAVGATFGALARLPGRPAPADVQ